MYDTLQNKSKMLIYLTFADSGQENIEDVIISYASFITCIPGFENTTPNVRHNARQTTFRCNLTKVSLVPPLAIILPLIFRAPLHEYFQ